MDIRDLRHLSRPQLLELLLEVLREKQELEEELARARKDLERREVILQNAGSIAEAVVGINDLFATAQETAKDYLESIEALRARLEEEAEAREDRKWKEAADLLEQEDPDPDWGEEDVREPDPDVPEEKKEEEVKDKYRRDGMAYQLNQDKELLLPYRKACKKHTVTFELGIQEDTKRHLFALNDRVQRAGNEVSTTLQKRIDQMRRTRAYRKLCRDYEWKTEHMKDLPPDTADYQALAEGRRKTEEALSSMQREFGITRGEVQALMQKKAQLCSIPSAIASARGDDIWREIEKILRTGDSTLPLQERGDHGGAGPHAGPGLLRAGRLQAGLEG